MKRVLFTAILSIALMACKREQMGDKSINGSAMSVWKLSENLADPGDGSGTFHAVESNKTLVFYTNGTVACNGDMCSMNIASDTPSTGTYSISDSSIASAGCNGNTIQYQESEDVLILLYPCIEGCQAKYVRMN